jgi:hypothetical protein
MPEERSNSSLDVIGLKAYGEAVNSATKGLVDGAGAFLSRICLPGAEELGLLFKDRVSHWRAVQSARIVARTERIVGSLPNSTGLHAHPRIVGSVIANGSWVDSDNVQEMWAGLLASSCTEDGKDESNLIFLNLLSQLTTSQAKVLAYSSEKVPKRLIDGGLITAKGNLRVTLDELAIITVLDDVNRIDRELDHLRALGLLSMHAGMFTDRSVLGVPPGCVADVTPSDLGLQMYVRCQGSRLSPAEYFRVSNNPTVDSTQEEGLSVAVGQPLNNVE